MSSLLPEESEKPLFKRDSALLFGMLALYGICILGLLGAVVWWLIDRNQEISASPTVTSQVEATQEIQMTVAPAVHPTESETYSVVDTFDSNINDWSTGPLSGLDGKETRRIVSGVYQWEVDQVYETRLATLSDFVPMNDWTSNYDTYVDTKFADVPDSIPCSGLIVRRAPQGWRKGGYAFVICYSGHFGIYYHNETLGWQQITAQADSSIQLHDWNRLQVLVKDSHFVFLINHQIVYEMDDDRQSMGSVALVVIAQKPRTKILFDNFGFQPR